MTTRPEKSLRYFKFVYPSGLFFEARSEDGTLHNEKTFKHLVDILEDVEFEVLNGRNRDLVELLRRWHNM